MNFSSPGQRKGPACSQEKHPSSSSPNMQLNLQSHLINNLKMNIHVQVMVMLEGSELTSSTWGRIQMIPGSRRSDWERKFTAGG